MLRFRKKTPGRHVRSLPVPRKGGCVSQRPPCPHSAQGFSLLLVTTTCFNCWPDPLRCLSLQSGQGLGLCLCLLPQHEVRRGRYQPICAEWNEWKSKRIPISQLRKLRFREMKDNLPEITWPMTVAGQWRGLRSARFWSPNSELLYPVSHERSWGSWILCSLGDALQCCEVLYS